MKNITELKKIFIGEEMDLCDLDNKMMSLGYYSEGDHISSSYFDFAGITYTYKTDNDYLVNLFFENVKKPCFEDENNLNTKVTVKDIEII